MIVVDVETTGNQPDRHSIVAIGAVDFRRPDRQFYRECRIWDGAAVQEDALAVNGFSHEQVTDPTRLPLERAMGEFIAWCREADVRVLAGHNTAFDRDFLQSSADRFGLAWRFGGRVLDLHSFAWLHMCQHSMEPPLRGGLSGVSSDVIHQYVGLPEEPKPHHGLMGAKMEAEAFARLLRGTGLLPEFAQYPVPPGVSGVPVVDDQSALF